VDASHPFEPDFSAEFMILKLSQKAIILVAVPLIFELLFVGVLACLLRQAEQAAEAAARTREVMSGANHVTKLVEEAGITLYTFKNNISPDLYELYRSYPVKLEKELQNLYALTAGHPAEISELDQIARLVREGNLMGAKLADGMQRGENYDQGENLFLARRGVISLSSRLQRHVHRLAEIERAAGGDTLEAEKKSRAQIWTALIAGVVGSVLIAVVLLIVFSRNTTLRLKALVDNIGLLAANQPLKPPLAGADELALIDSTFHKMAGALAEASDKERAITENAQDAIVSLDADLKLVSINPAFESMLGSDQSALLGRRFVDLLADADKQKVREIFNEAREKSLPPTSASFFECGLAARPAEAATKSGANIEMRWSISWSSAEKNYFCVGQDVSERKRLEGLKQEFISMVSHDLRSPLMAVQANMALLQAGADGALSKSSAKRIADSENNISYVVSLINSLIDIERLDQEKLAIHRTRTTLADLVERSLDAVRPLAEKHTVRLDTDYKDCDLIADSGRITQVLINLLSNALKFSHEGGVVSVKSRVIPTVDFLEISIIDQGRGIPAEKLESIFGRFEQILVSDASEKGGAGLGLAICKRIVEEHGGTIGVESVVGQGSRFWFTLPL
jgi:PAS domain S-box-containing protein